MTGTINRLLLASVLLSPLSFVACSSSSSDDGTGGSSATGGTSAKGGSTSAKGGSTATTGGTSSKGGSTSASGGATTASGGASANGGASSTSKGGTTGSGGASGTSTVAACGTTDSSYTEDAQFSATALPTRWVLNTQAMVTGATLTPGTASPAANSTLCAGGCAVLTMTIPAGAAWGGTSIVNEWFAAETNLVGSTITFKAALEVDSAAAASLSVQAFTQGGGSSSYAWGSTGTITTSTLADVSAFHDIVVKPVNGGNYCASGTGAVGVQIQRSAATTADIVAKLYIKSVTITPPSGSGGTGGASSVGGASSTGGSSAKGGSSGTSGGASSTSTTATGGTSSATTTATSTGGTSSATTTATGGASTATTTVAP